LLLLLVFSTQVLAASVNLVWDRVTSGPLKGYMVYYGPALGSPLTNPVQGTDTKVDVGNNTTYTVPNLVEGTTYRFAVTAYDAVSVESGFSNEVSATVAYSLPVAQFTASTTSGNAPLAMNFLNTSTGNISTHAWTFGDGTTSAVQSPSHVYAAAGSYTVSLTVAGWGQQYGDKTNYVTVTATARQSDRHAVAGDERGRHLRHCGFPSRLGDQQG
jgi:PKD repeat protein